MAKYQVMPDLAPEDYEALKTSIAERGIQIPVLIDQAGDIIDGHHRMRIASELGINCPTELCSAKTEADKRALAVTLNLARRHLTGEQREQMWIAMRQDGMSYRQIAEADGTSSERTVRRSVAANAAADLPAEIKGKDGKRYPASKPRNDAQGDMPEEERAAWNEALKEGGQMIAEFAERREQNKRIARELGKKFPLSPATRKAKAVAHDIMMRLKKIDIMLKTADVQPRFEHHWDVAIDRARSIVRQLEQLS